MRRVFVAVGIRLYRDGIVHALASHGFSIVGTADNWRTTCTACVSANPDIVVLDLDIPPGVDALPALATAARRARIVVLGLDEEESEIMRWVEAGVAGYVTPTQSLDAFVSIIESVSRDEMPCSPRMTSLLLRRVSALAREQQTQRTDGLLTRRERQVAKLIDQGLSNKEIAVALSIEVATVKNHVHNILGKMQVHRRGEAVARLRSSLSQT